MKKAQEQLITRVLTDYATQVVPDDLDGWAAIQRRLQSRAPLAPARSRRLEVGYRLSGAGAALQMGRTWDWQRAYQLGLGLTALLGLLFTPGSQVVLG